MNRLINDRLSTYFIFFTIVSLLIKFLKFPTLICVLIRIYTITQRFKDDLNSLPRLNYYIPLTFRCSVCIND